HCHVPVLSATNPPVVCANPLAFTPTACVNRGVPEQFVWSGSNRLNVIVPVNGLNPPLSCAESFSDVTPTDPVAGVGVVPSVGLTGWQNWLPVSPAAPALSATTVALLFRFNGLPQSFRSVACIAVATVTR